MIPRYRLLAERLRKELETLERVVERAEGALIRAEEQPADQDYYLAAAALDLHGFYAGVERLFELIASDLDESRPASRHWHRDLLAQMALDVDGLRPAVLRADSRLALTDYLEFRHVVRNVYSFDLRSDRVKELVRGLRPAFSLLRRDLVDFAAFLEALSVPSLGEEASAEDE